MSDCIIYAGPKLKGGYGYWYEGSGKERKQVLAHRRAYEQAKGPIPPSRIVMHTCNNPPCWNAEHLILGTYKDNSHYMMMCGRNNPLRGRKHPKCKLSPAQVMNIKLELDKGVPNADLAKRYRVSKSLIGNIRYGLAWRWLTGIDPEAYRKPKWKQSEKKKVKLGEEIIV